MSACWLRVERRRSWAARSSESPGAALAPKAALSRRRRRWRGRQAGTFFFLVLFFSVSVNGGGRRSHAREFASRGVARRQRGGGVEVDLEMATTGRESVPLRGLSKTSDLRSLLRVQAFVRPGHSRRVRSSLAQVVCRAARKPPRGFFPRAPFIFKRTLFPSLSRVFPACLWRGPKTRKGAQSRKRNSREIRERSPRPAVFVFLGVARKKRGAARLGRSPLRRGVKAVLASPGLSSQTPPPSTTRRTCGWGLLALVVDTSASHGRTHLSTRGFFTLAL